MNYNLHASDIIIIRTSNHPNLFLNGNKTDPEQRDFQNQRHKQRYLFHLWYQCPATYPVLAIQRTAAFESF